jgi:hypothetical protein
MKKQKKNEALSPKEGYDHFIASVIKTRWAYMKSNEKLVKKLIRVALNCNEQNSIESKLSAVQLYSIMTEKMLREMLYLSNLLTILKNPDKRLKLQIEDSNFHLQAYHSLKKSPNFINKTKFISNVSGLFRAAEKYRYVLASVEYWDLLPEIESDIMHQFEKVSENFSASYEEMQYDYIRNSAEPPTVK